MTTRTISAGRVETSLAPAQVKSSTMLRMAYLDTLKIGLTALVIAHHAGQAYGDTGGQWPIFNDIRSPLLGPFFGVNASFFMGLFFLISGYFVPYAFDRKGPAMFLKDRFRRLGIPLLAWALVVSVPILYFSQDEPRSWWQFLGSVYPDEIPFLFSHLWFVAHLLVYALGYALWRGLTRRSQFHAADMPLPTHRTLLAYVLVLALTAAIVRVWYPIDRWATLLIVPAELAHVPQYLSLFVLGIVAYRGDWLRRLPTATSLTWLGIGLAAAAARYVVDLNGWQRLRSNPAVTHLAWNVWEAFICVGLCVGLLILFREHLNRQPGRLLTAVAGAAYAAYIIHAIVVIVLQFGMDGVALAPLAKFGLVTLVGVPLSFGLGHLLRQVPGAKRVL